MRHNELCDRVADLSGKAFTPTHVHNNLLIFAGRAVQIPKSQPSVTMHYPSKKKPEVMEQKGDLLIRKLWQNGTDSVCNMRVMKTDSKSYLAKIAEKFLQKAAMEK